MIPVSDADARCSECHGPLGADGVCVACLLRGGLSVETLVADDPAATVYGDFEIARRDDGSLWELGRGAMGITYKAVDRVLHRPVALKVIQLGAGVVMDASQSDALRERFLREARAAAALRHANIAGVFHFGTSDQIGRCFYAMELVEGETLDARVRRDGPLDVPTVLEIARQVTAALVAAAGRGLVHRDLKPGNLMLTGNGGSSPDGLEVKVIDFGLAKAAAGLGETDLTHGGFVGTPAFASPEQFSRDAVDARSDLYSLGVTLWYALTGRAPFAGRTLEEIGRHPARLHLPVELLAARNVPACVVVLLRRVLAVDPAERTASAKEFLRDLDTCRRQLGAARPSLTRRRVMAATATVLALGVGGMWWGYPSAPGIRRAQAIQEPVSGSVASVVPEKSVAVLPFENLSDDKDNGYFTDGVQDEILTDLSHVADLKVISRSSVMKYKDARQRNLREIGNVLGVSFVVEGSVQRAGSRIKVNAELIDTRTDAHRWGDRYNRDLQDVFAVQTEIAQAIAGQLQAVISPREHAAMEEVPTHDLKAYELYLRGREVWFSIDQADYDVDVRTADLLTRATALDPHFTRAFALLAEVQGQHYHYYVSTPAQEAIVRELVETVARLRPDSGDALRAAGVYEYFVRRDFARARDAFASAARLSPNDDDILFYLMLTDRRQGRWEEALAHIRQATALDPENGNNAAWLAGILAQTGCSPEALAVLDHWIAAHPQDFWACLDKARVLLEVRGLPDAARSELARLPSAFDPSGAATALRLECDYAVRDFEAAGRDLAACSLPDIFADDDCAVPRAFHAGCIARFRGDPASAASAFAEARTALADRVRARPGDADLLAFLAVTDAALGQRETAVDEGRRAVAMQPPEVDSTDGPVLARRMACVLAWTDQRDESIRTLQKLAAKPNGPTYGLLKLQPDWDSLRGDPRFEALVASLAPKPGP